jgi:hypothetical protein
LAARNRQEAERVRDLPQRISSRQSARGMAAKGATKGPPFARLGAVPAGSVGQPFMFGPVTTQHDITAANFCRQSIASPELPPMRVEHDIGDHFA